MGGKVWLIPLATHGPGRACAEMALERGDRVVAGAPSVDQMSDLADRYGDLIAPVVVDLARCEGLKEAVLGAQRRFGRLDVVLINPGYALLGAVEELDGTDVRAQFDANVLGPMALIQHALPLMRAQGGGRIIATSDLQSLAVTPFTGCYSASLQAFEYLLEALSHEVRLFGISVTLLHSGVGGFGFSGEGAFRVSAGLETYGSLRDRFFANAASITFKDPAHLAAILLEIADSGAPSLKVFAGPGGLDLVRTASTVRLGAWEAWSAASRRTRGPRADCASR